MVLVRPRYPKQSATFDDQVSVRNQIRSEIEKQYRGEPHEQNRLQKINKRISEPAVPVIVWFGLGFFVLFVAFLQDRPFQWPH